MKTVLSPKELARAIGVSESSVKRWVDDGSITAARTAGGHRRIPLAEALRFIRCNRATVVEPQVLGLSDLSQQAQEPRTDAVADLLVYLQEGRAPQARGLILGLYLEGRSVAEICDGPVRSAMVQIGNLWRERPDGVMVEHRATDICLQAFSQLRLVLKIADEGPVAVGGAPSGDPYLLPSLMASAVLESLGFQAVNLGPDTPIETLQQACEFHQPSLVWLSVSEAHDAAQLSHGLERWIPTLLDDGVQLIIGGRNREQLRLLAHENVLVAGSMAELAAFGQGLRRDQ